MAFVVLHYPPFDPDDTGHILVSGNEAFKELTRTHEVGYVPAGHIHAYAQAVRDGTTHVITGGGGAPLHTYAATWMPAITT
jgi:Icc-related predicted phosphoesterase